MPQTVPQDEIIIDGARLRRAFRHQGRFWLWLGPVSVAAGVLLLGALVPRTYTAVTSVALQQTSGSSAAIALLTGGGGGASKRYLGILKSRALAETVEHHAQLRQLYGAKTFKTEEDAVEFLQKAIKPDDSAPDGLLYVSVTLPGPSKFSLRSSPTAAQAESAAADVANDYARALKEYYTHSDTDQGSLLLRGADKEVREARANYNDSVARLIDFTGRLGQVDPRSAPSLSSAASGASSESGGGSLEVDSASPAPRNGTDSATAASGLPSLYAALNQVEEELRSVQASQAAGQKLVGDQIRDLSNVPTDDPLLANARNKVTLDQGAYDTAVRLYGPENPLVIQTQTRLEVDTRNLNQQIQGVKRSLTTPDIRTTQQIQGLRGRQAVLTTQIARSERQLGISRKLSGEAGRLQAEVSIQLDVLRTTLSEAAKIRLDNASSLNRIMVVDTAIPPKNGEPGLSKLAAICVALALLGFLVAVIREYFRTAPARLPTSRGGGLPPSGDLNGADPTSSGMAAEDREDAALREQDAALQMSRKQPK